MISFVYPDFLWFGMLIPLTVVLAVFGRQRTISKRFWISLALRVVLMSMIVLALAGIQLHLSSNLLTAVFMLDYSDSISPAERARGEEIIHQVIDEMPDGDQAAIIVFGEDALVDRLSGEEDFSELTSIPVSTRTDIYAAMQLAMALFPDEGAKRLVLLSDGRENLHQAVKQAEMASMQNIELVYVPLGEQKQDAEVLVENLKAPTEVHKGEDFDLEITVQSSVKTGADLQVFADDRLIYSDDVSLQPDTNRFRVAVDDGEVGFHRYRAVIVADSDQQLQNNESSAFTRILGPARVLLVEGSAGEATNLEQSLKVSEMQVETVSADLMPTTLEEIAAYDAVVLVNVPVKDIPAGTQKALPVYVRDLGRGLLMVGGEHSYGAGGYLRTDLEEILPVSMEVSSQERSRNLALVLAVDKSGSMGRCHCDSSDLHQNYTRQEVGQPKVDIAKEAIMRSANALGKDDYLGVVSFDDQAHWTYEVSPLPDQTTLENAIGAVTADGQTNLQAGMQAAYDALKDLDVGRKHVIMLTDGWSYSGDISGLVHKMNEAGITVSLVAAGSGSADYLRAIADAGGGRYYAAEDMFSVPDIFLKETVKSVGEYIIEEPFYPVPGNPSPILSGLDETLMPALQGYNGTTLKKTARLDLLTPRGDPLLASWQYGLGKTAVWTSDLKGQWATDWVTWDDFSHFTSQLVNWLLPAEETQGLHAQALLQDEGVLLQADVEDEQGHRLNNLEMTAKIIDPSAGTRDIRMKQTGAGHYESLERLDKPGTYLITIQANDDMVPLGQTSLGLVVPYSPEYRQAGLNLPLLEHLAFVTGGSAVEEISQIYQHNLLSQTSAKEIWHSLLIFAILCFPLDVALRRLSFNRRDWQEFRQYVTQKMRLPQADAAQNKPRVLGTLFDARQRARENQEGIKSQETPALKTQFDFKENGRDDVHDNQGAVDTGDAMKRLQEAKRRARQNRG